MGFINWHGHTDASNHNNRDSIIKTKQMIDTALALGHKGVGITDHAVLSNHVKAIKYLQKLRKDATKELEKDPSNLELQEKVKNLNDFKLGLGCEIYLVNKDEIDLARENNEYTKFYHLVMHPKNLTGYRQLAKISSQGWENSFHSSIIETINYLKRSYII